MIDNLQVPFKQAKRKGIFCLNKEEKQKIELSRKKKLLNKKTNRKKLLEKYVNEKAEKEKRIATKINDIEKFLQAEKNKIQIEAPKKN